MALDDVQRVLTRLLTDPAFRERFLADPEATARAEGLAPADARALAGVPAAQVRRAGAGLANKRRRGAAGCLPMTRRALGEPRFADRFRAYAPTYQPTGPKRHRDDAVAFAAWLKAAPDGLPAWVVDLAAFEAAALRARAPGRRCVSVRLRHAPADLAAAAMAEGPTPEPPFRPTRVVWLRLTRTGRLRSFAFWSPW